ncbi:hypothetical protein V1477_012026 [Vespula maculifrons]|uniref:Uncharacterized protein n=1 Tax=Vespula maculifrons TaxID=7453 RepID=A0ABD2C0V7_VESMC
MNCVLMVLFIPEIRYVDTGDYQFFSPGLFVVLAVRIYPRRQTALFGYWLKPRFKIYCRSKISQSYLARWILQHNPFRTPYDGRYEHVKDYNALLTRLGSYPRTLLVKRTTVADSTGLEMVTKPLNCQTNERKGYGRGTAGSSHRGYDMFAEIIVPIQIDLRASTSKQPFDEVFAFTVTMLASNTKRTDPASGNPSSSVIDIYRGIYILPNILSPGKWPRARAKLLNIQGAFSTLRTSEIDTSAKNSDFRHSLRDQLEQSIVNSKKRAGLNLACADEKKGPTR